jgi:hypothetical protein
MLVQRHERPSVVTESTINTESVEKTRGDVFRAAPLCQRAWALQERLLSPRLLFYSDEEMFWECLVHAKREGNHRVTPHAPNLYRYESYECAPLKLQLIRPLDDNPSFPISSPSDWQIIVSEYSRCCLTYRSDKLPALSGLANMFQRNTGYTYAAGMWIENLASELLWFCPIEQNYQHQDLETDSGTPLEPSWSWTSTDLAVRFKSLGNMTKPSMKEFQFIRIDKPDTSTDDQINSTCMLTVKSDFYQVSIQNEPGSRRCIILDSSGLDRFGSGILDAIEEHPGGPRSAAAIIVRRKLKRDPMYEVFDTARHMTYFLLVVPARQVAGKECWRRIGLGWTNQGIMTAPEMSLICLV